MVHLHVVSTLNQLRNQAWTYKQLQKDGKVSYWSIADFAIFLLSNLFHYLTRELYFPYSAVWAEYGLYQIRLYSYHESPWPKSSDPHRFDSN